MAGRVAKRASRRVVTTALVVRSVAYGESDLIVTLLTEAEGKVSAIVRGARKGSRRVAGALEPMHSIAITYEDKGTELVTLKEAHVVRARTGIMSRLEAMDAAGMALRWARHMFPPKTEEPAAFATLNETLDALDAGGDPDEELAIAGLRLLSDVGWGLELEQCIVCGAKCPEDASAQLDPARGGIVCRKCGGARVLLRAPVRRAAITALRSREGSTAKDVKPHAKAIIELAEAAMTAHTGFGEK